MGCLYRITSPKGKSYIGISKRTAEVRFDRHVTHARAGRRNPIHRAILKYGRNALKVETLIIANSLDYLRMMERRAIKAFKTMAPYGYNLSVGGEDSNFWHPDVIARMGAAQSKAWARDREKRIKASVVAIAAMTKSRGDPAIEVPRRSKISAAMKATNLARGENNNMAKLTPGCVHRIRDMLALKVRRVLICEYFGVSIKLISLISQNKRWSHV